MPTAPDILVAVIACSGRLRWHCGFEFEGTWEEPQGPMAEYPEDSLQLCPECGHVFTASWPGSPFRTEAG